MNRKYGYPDRKTAVIGETMMAMVHALSLLQTILRRGAAAKRRLRELYSRGK